MSEDIPPSTHSDDERKQEGNEDEEHEADIEHWIDDDKDAHFRSTSPDPLGSDTSGNSPSAVFPGEEEDDFDRRMSSEIPHARRPSIRRRTVSNLN